MRVFIASRRFVSWVTRALTIVTGVIVLSIMVLTVADVARRTFEGRSVPGALEWTEVLLVAVAFGGLAAAEAAHIHVRTDIVLSHLPRVVAHPLRILGFLLTLAVVGVIIVLLWDSAIHSIQRGEVRIGLAAVPIWPARVALVIAFTAYLLQLIVETVAVILRIEPEASLDDPPIQANPDTARLEEGI